MTYMCQIKEIWLNLFVEKQSIDFFFIFLLFSLFFFYMFFIFWCYQNIIYLNKYFTYDYRNKVGGIHWWFNKSYRRFVFLNYFVLFFHYLVEKKNPRRITIKIIVLKLKYSLDDWWLKLIYFFCYLYFIFFVISRHGKLIKNIWNMSHFLYKIFNMQNY